eukprot:4758436-Ditylum_brightwellii.AAC.1
MLKEHNIQSWLDDNLDWCALQNKPQTLFIPSGTVSVPYMQAALAVMNSTFPDNRAVHHKIWGSTILTASESSKQVKLGVLSQYFEEILRTTGSKSDRAQMFAKSLADFLEEVPSSTRSFLFKLTFPLHIGFLFCNLLLEMCLKKTPLSEDRAFLDKKVSILNLFPPDLLLNEMTAQVSVEKMAAIENMVDMPTAKRSKMHMSMNTIGLCKTKENVLEIIANWLLLFHHSFM